MNSDFFASYNIYGDNMKWYEIIRNLREDKDLTQTDVAKILGVSQRVYSNYECGQVEISLDSLMKLADYYGVSMDYILGRSKYKGKRDA